MMAPQYGISRESTSGRMIMLSEPESDLCTHRFPSSVDELSCSVSPGHHLIGTPVVLGSLGFSGAA